jgi:hypothetical protein
MQALLAEQFDEADVEQRGLERDLTELSALKAERGLADTVFPEELEPEAICAPAALLSGLLLASVPASHRPSILPRHSFAANFLASVQPEPEPEPVQAEPEIPIFLAPPPQNERSRLRDAAELPAVADTAAISDEPGAEPRARDGEAPLDGAAEAEAEAEVPALALADDGATGEGPAEEGLANPPAGAEAEPVDVDALKERKEQLQVPHAPLRRYAMCSFGMRSLGPEGSQFRRLCAMCDVLPLACMPACLRACLRVSLCLHESACVCT